MNKSCVFSIQSRSWLGIAVVFLAFNLAACSKKNEVASQQAASTINDGLGCQNFKSVFMDSLYSYIDTVKEKPDIEQLKHSLAQTLEAKYPIYQAQKLKTVIFDLLESMVSTSQSRQMSAKDFLHFLIQIEFENQSTELHRLQSKSFSSNVEKVMAVAKALQASCQQPPPSPVPELDPAQQGAINKQLTLPLFGAYFSMATAYQSCQSVGLPEVSTNTEDVVGVRKGEDIGGGFKREYASVSDIVRTHYYIRQQNYPQGCFDLTKKPLVYDYGGEPSVEQKQLNFFVNAGPGGTALGIDCSAFVSSALAAAGLRYSPGVENKAIFVRQLSTDFIDPQTSGWKCFDRIQVSQTESIQPGDIVAVKGHVVMVDRVGSDPFGLSRVQSRSACDSLQYTDFDFSVIQSSPSKGSIGINKYTAKDYLIESSKMQTVFLDYARAACLAKFDRKSYKPASSEFGIIRHSGTDSCRAPRIVLANQACIKDCSAWQ